MKDSKYNRRITGTTEIAISVPPPATSCCRPRPTRPAPRSIGTGYNCSGGVTPWGTILTCEEGLSDTFGGDPAKAGDPEAARALLSMTEPDLYGFARIDERFVARQGAERAQPFRLGGRDRPL